MQIFTYITFLFINPFAKVDFQINAIKKLFHFDGYFPEFPNPTTIQKIKQVTGIFNDELKKTVLSEGLPLLEKAFDLADLLENVK